MAMDRIEAEEVDRQVSELLSDLGEQRDRVLALKTQGSDVTEAEAALREVEGTLQQVLAVRDALRGEIGH
jgi:hypothetical protein